LWLKKIFSFDGVKINQCTGNFGIHVGDRLVSDPDYAYDAALFNTEPATWNEILKNMNLWLIVWVCIATGRKPRYRTLAVGHHHYLLYLLKLMDRL